MVYTLSSVVSSAETLNEVIEARQEKTIAIDKIIDNAFIFIFIPPFVVKIFFLHIILYNAYQNITITKEYKFCIFLLSKVDK